MFSNPAKFEKGIQEMSLSTEQMIKRIEVAITPPAGSLSVNHIKANALLMKAESLISDGPETRDLFFDIATVHSCLHDHIVPSDILVMLRRLEALEEMMESIETHYPNQDMDHVTFRIKAMENVVVIREKFYD